MLATGRATEQVAEMVRTGLGSVIMAVRVVLAVAVALIAFPMAGLAVVLIEVVMVLWPGGE